MSKSYTLTPPAKQAKALFWGGMIALGAVELGGVTYAMQTASPDQVLDLGGGLALQTDVVLKAAMQIAAGLCLAIGPAVAAWQWRGARRNKTRRAYAWVAIAASIVGFAIAAGNLSGYRAWTRDQHVTAAAAESPLYRVALANAARAEAGQGYLSASDRAALRAGEAPTTAQRTLGDWIGAGLTLLLVSAMGSGFQVAGAGRAKRTRRPKAARRPLGGNVAALDPARRRA